MTEEQCAKCEPLPRELKERMHVLLVKGASLQIFCMLLVLLLAAIYALLCGMARQSHSSQGAPCLLANASVAATAMLSSFVTS